LPRTIHAATPSEGSDITVTDTQEQTLPIPAESADGSGATRPTKKGSLSTLLLPELQRIAGGLGISTTKMRKSDLVAAIQAAQAGGGSNGAGTTAAAPRTSSRPPREALVSIAETEPSPNGSAHRETPANDLAPAAAPVSDTAPPVNDQAGERRANGQRNQSRNRDRDNRDRDGQRDHQNRDAQNRDAQNRDDQNRNNQNRDYRDNRDNQGQNRDNRDGRDNNRDSSRDNQNRNDDDEFGSRRGRRYRDRRGRSRDRIGQGAGQGGSGNQDVEPTVGEDDVLTPVAGILDTIEDKNTWFVRTTGYYASSDDVYVANSYIRRYNLRRGDAVIGAVRQPRDGERREKYNPLVRLDTVNGKNPEELKNRVEFTKLTPLYPQERLRLETEPHILTTRVIDLVMPIGKGQRALIVSPPKAGKTMVLQAIANAIATNNPECHLMVVLVDERPEEVTDMQRSVKGEVIASTFDRKPQDHIMVAELSIERAKRLVEMGMDVVVLLDSITRLGRAYNLGAPASGRILSGGVDSTALYPPKRFLGAARNIENGGSLTILATALVETGSAGDTVIFEEFKGTGNAEIKLDRKIADKRVFPAIDVDQSSTRKEEILLTPDELAVTIKLRRVLHALDPQQAIDLLLDRLRKTRTNLEFLMQIAKTTPGQD
jgi:transcription termination factor Rho